MILPSLMLPSLANVSWEYNNVDTFSTAPKQIASYYFNSRGFRDAEWPDDLHSAIWCIGDSFTVGIGNTLENIWPQILSRRTGLRTINVSMDGASNTWIARKTTEILKEIQPKTIIIHWGDIQRREKENIELPDEDRKLAYIKSTLEEDRALLLGLIQDIEEKSSTTTVIHSFTPKFTNNTQIELFNLKLQKITNKIIPEFKILDLAKDYFQYSRWSYQHYGVKTAESFVDSIITLL